MITTSVEANEDLNKESIDSVGRTPQSGLMLTLKDRTVFSMINLFPKMIIIIFLKEKVTCHFTSPSPCTSMATIRV